MSQINEHQLPEKALRLVLTYRRDAPAGEEVTLREVLHIEKQLMPPDELPRELDRPVSGFWYELHDADGKVLYRRIIGNPIRTWIDLPGQEDPTRLVHSESLPDEKTFSLLVPAFPKGTHVILFSSPLDPLSAALPAEPRWRIQLPPQTKQEVQHGSQ